MHLPSLVGNPLRGRGLSLSSIRGAVWAPRVARGGS